MLSDQVNADKLAQAQQRDGRYPILTNCEDLSAAEVIVSVGRGIKEADNIPLVRKLADVLGAELAASRLTALLTAAPEGLPREALRTQLPVALPPRAYDAILDPIMGFISDNTRSKWGRRRQYVFIGAIMLGVGFVAMWQLHRADGIPYNFAYFLFWSLVFFTGLTVFSIPYVAMGYEMSDDFHERTSIMAVAQWIGQWAWVIAPWFWVVMYDPKWFPNADTAARTLSVWVGLACMLLAMVPAVFLPSRSTQDDTHLVPLTLANIGMGFKELLAGFKEAFGCVPFRKLCFATFLIFNAFNTVAAFSFFIVVYLHMLRGMRMSGQEYPFASVDSADIARNHNGKRDPVAMATRWDARFQ